MKSLVEMEITFRAKPVKKVILFQQWQVAFCYMLTKILVMLFFVDICYMLN